MLGGAATPALQHRKTDGAYLVGVAYGASVIAAATPL